MDDTKSGNNLKKRKRGRPPKYSTQQSKAAADVKRKREARQNASSAQRDIAHTSFYNPVPSLQPANILSGLYSPANPADVLQAGERDITQFLAAADHQLEEDTEEPAAFDAGTPADANSPDVDEAFIPDAGLESSPQPGDDEPGPAGHLARELGEQLIKFRGCCSDCHQAADQRRLESPNEQISLVQYLESTAGLGPDVLGSKTIASQKDDLAGQVDPESRRKIFCGLESVAEIPYISLDKDERVSSGAGVTFDVDSIIGFPNSLAVAKRGIRWSPTRMTVSDLQSDLHLRPIQVTYNDQDGVRRQVRRPVHQVPHYTFGRIIGFEDISLYFIFPKLYRAEQKSSKLRDEDFQLWVDGILLPAIYQSYSSAQVQHYPSSYDHSRYNSTARGVETLTQHVHPVSREQQLVYFLPPEPLADIWAYILNATQKPGFHQFQDVTILLQAKNLKTITKDVTWEKMESRFEEYWTSAVDEDFITTDLYIDVGKETCPEQMSKVTPWNQPAAGGVNDSENLQAEALLYKRCCLESYSSQIFNIPAGKEVKKQVFYPFTLLRDTGSLTIETGKRSQRRSAGLLYSQFYPSIKEVFAAGNVYPFTNAAIETLALDRKLRKTWELVGGGLSHQPVALVKAYLYTKLRCHFASLGSMEKSFGIREEHRISRDLFQAIGRHIRSRGLHNQRLVAPTGGSFPHYSFTTNTLLRWIRWNVNKFCMGFEMVYSFQNPHFVTWEHTRVMLMFLRCLQFSYAGGLIQKVGGCWQDVRQQPDPHQPNGLRRHEGLGFRRTMDTYGYAWFLDKVDWSTLTFRQPYAPYMMFNSPSIRRPTAPGTTWFEIATPACLDLLGDYLREFCLCAFRKDVFFHIKAVLEPEHAKAALAGEIPLCYDSVRNAMLKEHQPPELAGGNRLAVKDVHVLDDQFERQGWNDKQFRMLFQQSFHAIKTARGKAGARKWRQELKRSFLGNHWLLPYPHSRGFMRKGKEEKQVLWWPSAHDGLIRHYGKSHEMGTLRHPLPASNVRLHPADGWKLASSAALGKSYMPYVIQPEQELIQMPESDLYARLVSFREQAAAGPSQVLSAAPVVEIDNSLQGEYFPYKWCDRRKMRVAKTFDECEDLNDCLWFLKKGLQTYENLQSHRPSRRNRRRKRAAAYSETDSDSTESSGETETTSDEESLAGMRKEKAQAVQKMNARVRELIDEFKLRYPRWQKSYDPDIKELDYRLERAGLL
ncbi:hypothetical protein V8C42DRAFT_349396 [Trichoderma barbatum]